MTESPHTPEPTPQSLALNARAVAMLKAMGVNWRWPAPTAAPAPEADGQAGAEPLAGAMAETASVQTAPAPAQPAPAQPAGAERRVDQGAAPDRHAVVSPTAVRQQAPAAPTTPEAPAVPIQHIDVNDLRWEQGPEQLAQCQACGLHSERLGTEWGQGSERARWLFVTAGLHADDLDQGTVQGQELALLQSIWAAMGLDPADVFVTSITKCRPAPGRAPTHAEVDTCLAYLRHQHQCLAPDMVVAMGLPVAHALWGSSKQALAQWRAEVREWQGTPAIVTYPLDALLRRPIDQTKVWADLCVALEHVANNPQAAATPAGAASSTQPSSPTSESQT